MDTKELWLGNEGSCCSNKRIKSFYQKLGVILVCRRLERDLCHGRMRLALRKRRKTEVKTATNPAGQGMKRVRSFGRSCCPRQSLPQLPMNWNKLWRLWKKRIFWSTSTISIIIMKMVCCSLHSSSPTAARRQVNVCSQSFLFYFQVHHGRTTQLSRAGWGQLGTKTMPHFLETPIPTDMHF